MSILLIFINVQLEMKDDRQKEIILDYGSIPPRCCMPPVFSMAPWLLEGPEYMRPKLIFQSDICIILVQFFGIQSQFLAISFLGPQTTMIRIKYNPFTYLLVVFFDPVSVYCDKLQATNLLQGQRRQPF